MDTKLTLKLEENIISRAKEYAKEHHQSLSKLVESFFKSLTESSNVKAEKLPPTVKSLAGIMKESTIKDAKKDYADYLVEKYS
jgi:hypothetical protein